MTIELTITPAGALDICHGCPSQYTAADPDHATGDSTLEYGCIDDECSLYADATREELREALRSAV